MFPKNINIFKKLFQIIYVFSTFFGINSINLSFKKISIYKEEKIYLDKDNPMEFYLYQNIRYQQENNYDIIIQIKELIKQNCNANIYIYTTNSYENNLMNIIKIDETNGNLFGYQLKFDINQTNENYSEFSLSNNNLNNNKSNYYYQFYYIAFVKETENRDFKMNFIIFNTLDEIDLIPNEFTNKFYFRYENNYVDTNYIFKINLKNFYKFLNIQFLSFFENNLFNINIYTINENVHTQIFSLENFYSLDYTIEISDTKLFYLNLSFIKINNNNIIKTFSIFFDFLNINLNNFQKIQDLSMNFIFLSKEEYYLYKVIENSVNFLNNEIESEFDKNLFFILKFLSNDDILINYDYFSLYFLIFDLKDSYNDNINEINNEYLNNLINNNKNNFNKLKSFYDEENSLFYYKANVNKNENLNKLIILKIYLNDKDIKNKLKIKNINFRSLPLIVLTEEIYNIKQSYIKFYNSKNDLDKIGYYYIPKKSVNKNKLLYCPYETTMNLYLGEFDITENIMLPAMENQKLIIINPYNITLFNGITIITKNNNNNYFIQYGEIDDIIINNLKINYFIREEKLNKEISIKDNIKELYYFNIYNFNDSFILDINLIYGNVTVEYLSLDSLSDIDKNFYNIFPFNKELLIDNIKIINNPILINASGIEVIRIINNQYINDIYNSNILIKNLFYINKYKLYSEIEENQLLPLFISSNDIFTKYRINLNSLSGEIKYKFLLINNGPFIEDDNEYNISISINNESFYLSKKDNNLIHRGIINIIRFNQVKITNNCHKNVLIWSQIGNLDENDYEVFYASEKAFNGIMTTGKTYLFVFDYMNIINKKQLELCPYKFIFNLEKPVSSKCNGYYFHSLVKSNFKAKNFVFSPTNVNSIYYEIIQSGNNISFYNDLSFEEFDFILKDKYYFNTLIQQINGFLKVNFYMEYKYNLTDKKNKLVPLHFDESIYSINFELAKSDKNKYLLFQILSCEYIKDFNVQFFKENSNISYSFLKYDDNGRIERITQENIFGFINIDQIQNEDIYNNFLGIIKPGKLFIRYFYTNSNIDMKLINSLHDESKYKYNINIEKIRKVENKDIFSISFDCFLKNTITSYFILTLNEKENDIINECQFLSYLYNYKNKNQIYSINNQNNEFLTDFIYYNKYISFKDEGSSDRISREITFDSYGNYKVYILAEELENYSLYKLLGVKTYSYINEGNDINKNEKENEVSIILILLIVLLSFLIIILSAFIIYHYIKKENINQIISFINIPNNDPAKSNKNGILLHIINNQNERSNENNSQKNNFFPIFNDNGIEFIEQNNNNDLQVFSYKNKNINNIGNNIIVNKDSNKNVNENINDLDEEKSEPPPPPITAVPFDNKISEFLNDIKNNNNNNGKIYDKEKGYTNDGSDTTNKGGE